MIASLRYCGMVIAMMALACRGHADELQDPLLMPTLSAETFQAAVEKMLLSKEHAQLVQSAYQRFHQDFAWEVERVRRQYGGLQAGEVSTGSWTDSYHRWLLRRHELEERFDRAILEILDGDAAATWKNVMIDARRGFVLHELHKHQRQRHAYDVVALLESVQGLSFDEKPLADLVQSYRIEMDERILEYERQRAPISIAVVEHRDGVKLSEHGAKFKNVLDALNAWHALSKGIRATNERFVQQIAEALNGPQRDAFVQARDQFEYPEAFQPSPPQIAIQALRLADNISSEKRAALETVFAQFKVAADELNRTILQTVRRWEAGEHPIKREIAEVWQRSERGEITIEQRLAELEPRHPANPLLKRRHELAIEAIGQMRILFNDAEYQQLPLAARLALGIS